MSRHCSETENQLDVIKIGDIIILTQIMGRMGYKWCWLPGTRTVNGLNKCLVNGG